MQIEVSAAAECMRTCKFLIVNKCMCVRECVRECVRARVMCVFVCGVVYD